MPEPVDDVFTAVDALVTLNKSVDGETTARTALANVLWENVGIVPPYSLDQTTGDSTDG